jgi:AcrR family transcriptional regulator
VPRLEAAAPRRRHAPRPLVPARQARAVRTRAQLVAAARALLGDRGLAGAPTAAVAARAQVSHGALFRHFPHKTELLLAVTEAILADLRGAFAVELGPAPAGDPLTAACAALWRVFRRPDMRVVLEIYVAARTDGALARGLAPVLAHHQALLIAEARRLFPAAAAGNPEFDDAVMAIVYAMQGAAIGLFSPEPDAEIAHLAFLERLARRELARRPPRAAAPSPRRKA